MNVGGKGKRKVVYKQTTDGCNEGSTCVDIARWTGEVGGRSSGECAQVNGRCV